MPRRALGFSLTALGAPILAAFFAPESLANYSALLWLSALLPGFLLAYYRGWRGVATSLALGMATLSLTHAAASLFGRPPPDLLLGVVTVYLAISLALGWLAEQLHRDRAEAADMAFTDLLTGLPNRRHADIFLRDEFAAAQRGRRVAVVLFDLDDFKGYNDAHGHSAGDEALRTFGRVLKSNTRRMNLGARYGGEEFLAVLAGSNPTGAAIFADRVRVALEKEALGDPPLTVSAGIALYEEGVLDPADLMRAADGALYEAKRAGRNQVKVAGGVPSALSEVTRSRAPERESAAPPPPPVGAEGAVLVVDPNPALAALVEEVLTGRDIEVVAADTAAGAIQRLSRDFDLLVTDIHLPGGSGHEVVRVARSRWPRLQILALTALQDARLAAEAVHAGADRTLFRPFDRAQLDEHLTHMLRDRASVLENAVDGRPLSPEGRTRATESRAAILRGVRAIVAAVEARDPFTRGHGDGVAVLALRLAELSRAASGPSLSPDSLRLACEVHDVGKIAVPDQILNKAGLLTPEEHVVVQSHARMGRRLLEPLIDDDVVLDGVAWHHEWWDGTGYPDGLVGAEIPLAARVVAVADVIDALAHPRAFREAWSWADIVAYLRDHRGRRFDPGLIDLVFAHLSDFEPEAVATPSARGEV